MRERQGLPVPVPMAGLPDSVRIWEVGPRDGLQNEPAIIPTSVKIEFVDRLTAAGLPVVETTSFVRADRVPQLADSTEVLTGIRREEGVRYPVLVPNLRGLESAVSAQADDIAVFASATESFAERNLGRSLGSQMGMFTPVIEAAVALGFPVRGYISMCFGDPWEGPVDPRQVVDVSLALLAAGCGELSLGDTIGVATPGQVNELIALLLDAGVTRQQIGVHFHDTYGQALSNTLAALRAGVSTVDSATGGLGGCPYAESATGNLATEDLVWMLDGLGVHTGVRLDELIDTSLWVADRLGRPPSSRVAAALGGR
jgi:hydroxymethylglutaryl-CoA lyase